MSASETKGQKAHFSSAVLNKNRPELIFVAVVYNVHPFIYYVIMWLFALFLSSLRSCFITYGIPHTCMLCERDKDQSATSFVLTSCVIYCSNLLDLL